LVVLTILKNIIERITPHIMENKIHVPNHQPVNHDEATNWALGFLKKKWLCELSSGLPRSRKKIISPNCMKSMRCKSLNRD
jgi:hypothetical protein